MQIRVNDMVAASGQIDPSHLPAIREAGYTGVIAVRPDEEVPPPIASTAMREAAEAEGLAFHYIPLHHGTMPSKDDARRFAEAARSGPVLGYCGGGPRVVAMASFASATEGRPVSDILSAAARAGIDLSRARDMLIDFGAEDA